MSLPLALIISSISAAVTSSFTSMAISLDTEGYFGRDLYFLLRFEALNTEFKSISAI